MRRSTSTASPVDDGGPSSSASLASTDDSSNFDELLVDVESVPKHLGTDCPDLVEVASKPGFRPPYSSSIFRRVFRSPASLLQP